MNAHMILSLFHVFLVVPVLFYVFYNRAANPDWIYKLLLGLGAFIIVYHAYKSLLKFQAKSASIWVNIIHVLFVGPLLVYIGYQGKKTERPAYELLGLITFAALGYHLYYLVLMSQIHDESE